MKVHRPLPTRAQLWIWIGVFVLGVAGGWGLKIMLTAHPAEPVSVRENSPEHHFVNPILYTKTDQSLYREFGSLDQSVSSFIESEKDSGKATDVSVYFRDANSGHWSGVNEDALYDPGSMLKVAALMGYLSDAQTNPSILSRTYAYTPVLDPGQHYPPVPLARGAYTGRQLLTQMITQSDNTATEILVNNDALGYNNVYKELELPVGPASSSTDDFMSVHEYMSLYQTLYNSTYLPSYLSDQALELLAATTFTKGLVAGVPAGTVVAHKFGEHTSLDENGDILERELHDCGVVYYPEKPYMLCVMTKGKDFAELEDVLSGLSKLVYDYVNHS